MHQGRPEIMVSKAADNKKGAKTSLELMILRAEKAELALQDSSKSLEALRVIQKNGHDIVQATQEIVVSLQAAIKENDKDAAQKNIALEELKKIVEENRKSLEKRASEYSEIHDMAFIDVLTGLPNRRLLNDRLNQIILNNKRWKSYSAAVFVDLDKFKTINDTYGHDAGDELLLGVANRLKACIRDSDTVARYGGDEFVVLLDNLDGTVEVAQEQAYLVASKILASLIVPYSLHLRDGKKIVKTIEYQIFASLGITMFDGVMSDREFILDRADKAMYLSKSKGGNTIRIAALPEQAKEP